MAWGIINRDIEWAKNVPLEWDICRLRNIGTPQNGISKGGEYFGYGYPFLSYGDVYKNFSIPDTLSGLIDTTENEREIYSVLKNDIFFTRTSETIDEVGFSSVCEKSIPDATFAGFLIRVRPFSDKLIASFAKYYFRSQYIRNYLEKEMNLVTRASLGQDLLKSMPILLPSKITQQKIADFLDSKTQNIDARIELLEKKKERYTVLRKALINEAVNGEGKGWKTVRMKDVVTLVTEKTTLENKVALENIEEATGRFVETDSEFEGDGVHFVEGDILYGKLRPYLRKVLLAKNEGNAVGDIFVFRHKKNSKPEYLKWLFLSEDFTSKCNGSTQGAKMPRVDSNFILTLSYLLPPESTQQKIVSYLDKKTSAIDSIVAGITKQIDSLKTYRRALINEAVTGKLGIE